MKSNLLKKTAQLSVIFFAYISSAQASDININELLPRIGEYDKDTATKYPEIGNVTNLPELTDTALFMNVIQIILGWSMLITLIALVVAAIYYLISRGKEEDITKAKDIIIYLLIGMGIMSAAYGIVVGITQFRFFD